MSFKTSNWGVISPSGNTQAITLQNGLVIGAPALYTYQSATETILTISSPDYFSPIGSTVAVGDVIFIVASDASGFYQILQVDFTLGTLIIAALSTGGDVTGPGASTNTAIARWNGASGQLLSNSTVLLDGAGNLTQIASATIQSAGAVNFNNAGNTFTTSIIGGNAAASTTYTLPTAYPGVSGDVLSSTTAGVMSWASVPTGGPFTAGSVIFSNGTNLAQDNSRFFWDDTAYALKLRTGYTFQFGTLDAFSRTQIWNFDTNAVLRLGSLASDGDPTTTSSEGIVVYGPAINGMMDASNWGIGRVKVDRLGLLSNVPGGLQDYYFRADPSGMFLQSDSSVKTFVVTRNTGNIKTSMGAGFVQSDASGNLSSGPLTGVVVGPVSSTNTALARWNGTTGALLEDSTVLLDNSGNLTGIASATIQSAGAVNFNNAGNTFSTSIIGGNAGANTTYTLPIAYPSVNNEFLTSTTAGVMSWAQAAGGVSSSRIVYVDAGGSDVTGNGSLLFPFATIFKANSVISGNANATRWVVSIGAGKFIETNNITLLPYVAYVGRGFNATYITSPNNLITPDASVGSVTSRIGLFSLYIGGTTSISFDLPSLGGNISCVLEISAIGMNAGVTFKGRTFGADFLEWYSGYAIGSIALSNANGFLNNVAISGNLSLDTAASSGNAAFNVLCTAATNVTVASTGGITNTVGANGCAFSGTLTVSGATTTLNSDAISLPTLFSNLTVSGGATLNYLTSAWGILAGYTPVHYTAVSTDVTGNLHGIDNALGAITPLFVNQTTASATLANNTTYLTNDGASLVTYTLPAVAAIGDTYTILGFASGGWTIAQGASQSIQFGNVTTTVGAGGSLSSSNQGDCITLRCAVANTTWIAYNAQGNVTYV